MTKTRAETLAYQREWHTTHRKDPNYRARVRAWRRKKDGIPDPTRPAPVVCECCGREPGKRGLVIDHDHVTGAFRGWLCDKCNLALGYLGDSLDAVERARAYLIRAELS